MEPSYRVTFLEDLTKAVVVLPDSDVAYLFADVGPALGRDPHGQGDLWMTLDSVNHYVKDLGEASLTYAVDDVARTVTVTSIVLPGH